MLETRRYIVNRLTRADAPRLEEILGDAQVMEHLETPFTRERVELFLQEAALGAVPLVYAVRERNGGLIGHAIFHLYDDSGAYEIGWVLDRAVWGQGCASELTEAFLQYAREKEIPALVLECEPGQEVTRHLAEKFGFSFQGTDDGLAVYRREMALQQAQ